MMQVAACLSMLGSGFGTQPGTRVKLVSQNPEAATPEVCLPACFPCSRQRWPWGGPGAALCVITPGGAPPRAAARRC